MIGERISELRKRKNMTQRQLADFLSVSLNSVSLYERNLSTPDDEMKIQLARLFNVSMDYLMGTSDYEMPLDKFTPKVTFLCFENLTPEAAEELENFMSQFKKKYKL